jgi:hypothetical protein
MGSLGLKSRRLNAWPQTDGIRRVQLNIPATSNTDSEALLGFFPGCCHLPFPELLLLVGSLSAVPTG